MNNIFLRDVLQWDFINWSLPLQFWEDKLSGEKKELKCLELGSREGGLSLWLALKGHSVITSDLINAEVSAKPLHKKYNVDKNIIYSDIDATLIPYENHFDIIVFKSILGGIGRNDDSEKQRLVLKQIHKALKHGGKLFFAENIRATLLHRFFRKNFTRWGKEWRYVSVKELGEYLSDFSQVEINTTGFTGVFGRTENQKNLLGKADKYFFTKIIPSSWNYIAYGAAVK